MFEQIATGCAVMANKPCAVVAAFLAIAWLAGWHVLGAVADFRFLRVEQGRCFVVGAVDDVAHLTTLASLFRAPIATLKLS